MFSAMGDVFQKQGPEGLFVGYVGVQYRQAAWSAAYFASVGEQVRYVDLIKNMLLGFINLIEYNQKRFFRGTD